MYGKFNSKDKLIPHLNNGAKVVSAPCKNTDKTIVFGVNEIELKNDNIISAHHVQQIVLRQLLMC